MRFSEFYGKEVIDVESGERLGVIGNTDLVIDINSGKIKALLIPEKTNFSLKKTKEEIYISWSSIRKIGSEMIIVEKKNENKI